MTYDEWNAARQALFPNANHLRHESALFRDDSGMTVAQWHQYDGHGSIMNCDDVDSLFDQWAVNLVMNRIYDVYRGAFYA